MSGVADATLLDPAHRSARGVATQAEITAAPAPAPTTPLEESWRDFIFAEVWTRPGLDRRARYLVAMASACCFALSETRLDGYVRGALASGELSQAELREAALHLGVYAGWGRGETLDRAVTRMVGALGLDPVASAPIRAAPWDPAVRDREGHGGFDKVMTFPPPPPFTPFQEAINNFVFGEMWCRPALDERSRRWITLVGICDSAAEIPIMSHIHAAKASGNCTSAELHEFVLQFGTHAGWPRASRIQGAVMAMSHNVEAGLTWDGRPIEPAS